MKKKKTFKTIKFDLSPEDFNRIAHEAHDCDITFNERVNQILKEMIEKLKDPKELAKFEKILGTSNKPTPKFLGGFRTPAKGSIKAGTKRLARVPKKLPKLTKASM